MNKWYDVRDKLFGGLAKELFTVSLLNDEILEAKRKSICESNSNSCFDSEGRRCKVCTCPIDAKAGLMFNKNASKLFRTELTHCPLGKWNDKDVANYYRLMDGKDIII